jgi:hypothetical protein
MEKIYIKSGRQKTVKEFINKNFDKQANSPNIVLAFETYSDPECTILQCGKNKFRSLEALHNLIKTYYPSYTIDKTVKALCQPFVHNDKLYYPNFVSCSNVKKITFLYHSTVNTVYHHKEYGDHKIEGKEIREVFKKLNLDNGLKFKKFIDEKYEKIRR